MLKSGHRGMISSNQDMKQGDQTISNFKVSTITLIGEWYGKIIKYFQSKGLVGISFKTLIVPYSLILPLNQWPIAKDSVVKIWTLPSGTVVAMCPAVPMLC